MRDQKGRREDDSAARLHVVRRPLSASWRRGGEVREAKTREMGQRVRDESETEGG
ncbi:uncharacterized protein G2W53_039728 [Senna tora]|uniref:Uncharacterized protein n=1 Tax=Senna tora TaxID=362788 RepID=A0A834SQ08_9FABA|nr:uncharacterized protein G2W53_039728 [Senna tora]